MGFTIIRILRIGAHAGIPFLALAAVAGTEVMVA